MSAIVTLKKGEGRTIKAGGAWIYDNEIDTIMGSFENGDIIIVKDFDGYPMGKGFINTNSKITVRMLTRHVDTEINEDFFRMRLQAAWDYRKKTVDTSSCRIVFGEADFLPGIVIDKFEDVLVVESLALGIDRVKNLLINILKIVTVLCLFVGGIVSSYIVWRTIDIFVGLLTIINTYSIFMLRDVVVKKVRSSN